MIDLFIVADDFTGALDTGVRYASRGVRTKVITNPDVDLTQVRDASVLVMDAETRHLQPLQAYETVYDMVDRASRAGARYYYKKTDSALRGNIGAELTAVRDALGCRAVPFLPAFPEMGRKTVGGIHYVDGVPVSQSVFGRDPFEPVTESEVPRLIAQQCSTPVQVLTADVKASALREMEGILLFDAETDEDLRSAGKQLQEADMLNVAAGCAGFGAVEQELLGLVGNTDREMPKVPKGLTVICGSVNPITQRQLDLAEENGFARLRLSSAQKLTPGWAETPEGQQVIERWRQKIRDNPYCIIDANDADGNQKTAAWAAEHGLSVEDMRVRISSVLGAVLAQLFREEGLGLLLITGGDTLLQCMHQMDVNEMEPLCEVFPGVVLSRFEKNGKDHLLISKSGGFGEEELLLKLKDMIERQ